MSGPVVIDMTEVVRLSRALLIAGPEAQVASEKVLDEVAAEVHADAQAAAPMLTGKLRASIYIRSAKTFRRVGSPLGYGLYQEFGTHRMAPQPWLYPAAEKGFNKLAVSVLAAADPLDKL